MKIATNLRALTISCGAALLVSAGCASPAGSGSAQGLSSLPATVSSAATITNVAGRYQGQFLLKKKVIGDAAFDLTQSGTAIGGTLKLVLTKTAREPVAMTFDATNNTFSGVATDPTGKTPCSYALAGSYNPKTFELSGTSSPLTCPGKVANFKTTESCFYNTSPSTNARRPAAHGILEC